MTTVNFIFIHGTKGYPENNWFPWLKEQLQTRGHHVIAPQFPINEDQNLSNWFKTLEDCEINDNTIIVGHSVGAAFIPSIAEKYSFRAAFLVCGFCRKLGLDFDSALETFVEKDFDWKRIRSNCSRYYQINSSDDPYVSVEQAKALESQLGVKMLLLNNAGHVNQNSGYTKLDEILPLIEEELAF